MLIHVALVVRKLVERYSFVLSKLIINILNSWRLI